MRDPFLIDECLSPDLVNRIVEVYSDGSVEIRDWPAQ
jgi:hypothetical protein